MDRKIYLVGGACRDILTGTTPKDYDFVAVGFCADDFIKMGVSRSVKIFRCS